MSVIEFMEYPRVLEAAMVRCGQNRAETKYEAECVNAREAVNRLASAEQEEQRQRLEAQSQRKRQALRRTQEAAAEARRRAMETQRLREEAEYLGLFEVLPTDQTTGQNRPQAVQPQLQSQSQSPTPAPAGEPVVGNDPSQVPMPTEPVPVTEDENLQSDLASIREELQRRRNTPE